MDYYIAPLLLLRSHALPYDTAGESVPRAVAIVTSGVILGESRARYRS